MLQYTATGDGARFCLYVHHTDADRESSIGKLDKSLGEAKARGWTVVNLKNDWNIIYPSDQ